MTFSASSIPRALRCLGSLVLPQSDYQTAYSDEGQDNHADMEAAADVGNIDALPEVVRSLIMPGDTLITEASFAYDVATDTARRLGGPRQYDDLRPFEIPGTPDLGIHGSGRLTVVDYKNFEEVDEAENNAQAATYALTLARVYGIDEVTVAIVYLGGLRRPSIGVLSAIDLDAHAVRLKALHLDVMRARAAFREGVMPQLATGSHCKYCSAFVARTPGGAVLCPEQARLKSEALTTLPLTVEASIPFQSDEDAARAFDILQRLKMLTTRLSASLYARAKERPIPLGDGKVLAEFVEEGSRKIDGDKAYALIRERHGQQVADSAVQRKVAQKWIEDALKEHGVKNVAKAKRELMDELEATGAVTRETKTSIKVGDAARLLKAGGE